MPIYEFACERCGQQFDKLMSLSAPAPPCPSCGGEEVRKLISTASFVLKGGGWYKDHYGLKSSSGGSGGSDAKPSGGSDAKPGGGSSGGKAKSEAA